MLKLLVSVLTIVMIVGFVIIVVLFVLRFKDFGNRLGVQAPEGIEVPPDVRITSYTQGEDWYLLVTDKQEILVFDQASGELLQRIELKPRNWPAN